MCVPKVCWASVKIRQGDLLDIIFKIQQTKQFWRAATGPAVMTKLIWRGAAESSGGGGAGPADAETTGWGNGGLAIGSGGSSWGCAGACSWLWMLQLELTLRAGHCLPGNRYG